MNEIKLDDIVEFENNYMKNSENKNIELNIKEKGLYKACLNDELFSKAKFKFNIETKKIPIYNQEDSHQCNIYSFLHVVKDVIRKNNIQSLDDIDLSANYISFFDKLEKTNALYNELIECDDITIDVINNNVSRFIGSYGTFHYCREIINKYGIVPASAMSELNEKYNDNLTVKLWKDKIKCDATSLIKLTKEEKVKKKHQLMNEIYAFLAKIMGNPPQNFIFNNKSMTPIEFKEYYLKDDLNDYVTITHFNEESFYNSYSFIPNNYLNDNEIIKHVSIEKMKTAIINQLKDDICVWFSSEESTTLDYDVNILDPNIYNFNTLLKIREIPKNKKIAMDIVSYDHAMCITGALLEKGEVKQFKVDNSFGFHGKYNGQLIMTIPFFENCLITAIVNKKYL